MITFHIPSMQTMFSSPSTSPALTIHWGETAAANQLRATASTRLHCTGLISVPVHVDFKVDSVMPNVNSLVLIRHLHPWSTKANLSSAAKRLQMVSVARSQTKTLCMCVVMKPNRGIGIFYWAKVSALNPEAVLYVDAMTWEWTWAELLKSTRSSSEAQTCQFYVTKGENRYRVHLNFF